MEQIKCYCGHTTYCDCGPLEEQSAVEWLIEQLESKPYHSNYREIIEQAKEMEKEQRGYSEEDVRNAYFQGEMDSYVKGGQTQQMQDEYIQSLKQTKKDVKKN